MFGSDRTYKVYLETCDAHLVSDASDMCSNLSDGASLLASDGNCHHCQPQHHTHTHNNPRSHTGAHSEVLEMSSRRLAENFVFFFLSSICFSPPLSTVKRPSSRSLVAFAEFRRTFLFPLFCVFQFSQCSHPVLFLNPLSLPLLLCNQLHPAGYL